jgi:hypothetical protein
MSRVGTAGQEGMNRMTSLYSLILREALVVRNKELKICRES